MAVQNIPRVSKDSLNANTGAVYHINESISSGTYSDIFLLPPQEIYAISAVLTGTGTVEFSNDPESVLDGGSPTWVEWDGSSYINPGITAVRIKRTSGTVTLKLTAKTAKM